jgi:hypothetical protein
VGVVCGLHGRGKNSVQGSGGKARSKETNLKKEEWLRGWDQMDFREIGWGHVECIHLTKTKDRWWALVNTMNLQVLVPWS